LIWYPVGLVSPLQVTVTPPRWSVAVTPVGAVTYVTEDVAPDVAVLPCPSRASTSNVYAVPPVSPMTVVDVVPPSRAPPPSGEPTSV